MTPDKHAVALTLALARIALLRDGGPDWKNAFELGTKVLEAIAAGYGEFLAAGHSTGTDHPEAGAGESAPPDLRTPASAQGTEA